MMVLTFKAINGTAPVYLQTRIKPHAPVRALHSTTSASWLVPSSQTKPAQQSRDSSLFWHLNGGMNSRPMSGQRNHSPSSAKDLRLSCSHFTSTPHSMTPSNQPVNPSNCSISLLLGPAITQLMPSLFMCTN